MGQQAAWRRVIRVNKALTTRHSREFLENKVMPHFSSISECLTTVELLLAPWNHQLSSPLSGLDTEWGGTACAFQIKWLWKKGMCWKKERMGK